jgi:hypothetical protein
MYRATLNRGQNTKNNRTGLALDVGWEFLLQICLELTGLIRRRKFERLQTFISVCSKSEHLEHSVSSTVNHKVIYLL